MLEYGKEIIDIKLTNEYFDEIKEISKCIDSVIEKLVSNGSQLNFDGFDVVKPYDILLDVYGKESLKNMKKEDIDLKEITKKYGINIIAKDTLDDNIKGCAYFSDEEITIEYIEQTNKDATNIIIAHELGHIFCHFTQGYKFTFSDNNLEVDDTYEFANNFTQNALLQASYGKEYDRYEREAQEFAIDLIYPDFMISKSEICEVRKLKTELKLNKIQDIKNNV